jgi:hypothetical protein
MKEILQEIGINIGISVAGLFGSLILIGKDAALKWKTSIFSIITGVASANYITPIIIDVARVDIKYQMSIGFVLGFLGLKGVELISGKLSQRIKNDNN